MGKIEYFSRNSTLLADGSGYRKEAKKNRVNINWWHIRYGEATQNIGDMLSEVVFDYLCNYYSLDKDKVVNKTKHLYAIGSILFFENQDATIWGTGCLHDMNCNFYSFLHQRIMRSLDVRAVRGPCTGRTLRKLKIKCPEVYGDPAMLMPLIYHSYCEKKYDYLVISHYKDYHDENIQVFPYCSIRYTNMIASDWKEKIDEIVSSKCVISSSLHGIVLAESYGIPAILLKPQNEADLFKYNDYYLGTDREKYVVVNSVEEVIKKELVPTELPQVDIVQKRLIESFPKDLWE